MALAPASPLADSAATRSRSADRPAISEGGLVRSCRAAVPLGPGAPRRAARHPALPRRLPVAARRARRRRGHVAQGDRQGPQRADAVLQSRPGGATAGPSRRGGAALPRHHPPRAGPCRGAAGAGLHPYGPGPLRRRRARARRVREQRRPGDRKRRPGHGGPEAAAGAGAQHAGPRALSHGPLRPRRSRCWTWPWSMPARMPPAAARSWATARWRWAASAITTRRSPAPGRRWSSRRRAPCLQHVLGFVLNFAGRPEEAIAPIQRALEIDPNFAGSLQDPGAGPDGGRQRRRGRRAAAARPAPEPVRQRRHPAALAAAHRAEAVRRGLGCAGALHKAVARRRAGAQQPGPGAARPEALRGGAAGAQARLAAVDRRSDGADQPRLRAGRSRPGRRGAVVARACAARPAGRFAPARPLRRLPGRPGREGQGARGPRRGAGGQSQQRRSPRRPGEASAHERGRPIDWRRCASASPTRRKPPAAIRPPSPWSPSPRPTAPIASASCWPPASASSARTACRRRRASSRRSRPSIADLELHLIGPLQTNKAREAVALFDVIQSVDRERLASDARQGDGTGRPAARLLHPGQYRRGAAEGRRPADGRRRLRRRLPRRPQAAGRRADVHPAGRRGAGAAFRPAGQDGRAQWAGQGQHGHERRLRDGRAARRHPCPRRHRLVRQPRHLEPHARAARGRNRPARSRSETGRPAHRAPDPAPPRPPGALAGQIRQAGRGPDGAGHRPARQVPAAAARRRQHPDRPSRHVGPHDPARCQECRRASVRAPRPCRVRDRRGLAGPFQRRTPLRPDAAGGRRGCPEAQAVQGPGARAARRDLRWRGAGQSAQGTTHADQGGPARPEDPGRGRQHICLRGAVPGRHLAAPLRPYRAGRARRPAGRRHQAGAAALDRRRRLDLARPCPAGRRARLFPDPLQRLRSRRRALPDAAPAARSSNAWCSRAARPSIARTASAS